MIHPEGDEGELGSRFDFTEMERNWKPLIQQFIMSSTLQALKHQPKRKSKYAIGREITVQDVEFEELLPQK